MGILIKYSRGMVKTEMHSALGASLKALLSRFVKEEIFSVRKFLQGDKVEKAKT